MSRNNNKPIGLLYHLGALALVFACESEVQDWGGEGEEGADDPTS